MLILLHFASLLNEGSKPVDKLAAVLQALFSANIYGVLISHSNKDCKMDIPIQKAANLLSRLSLSFVSSFDEEDLAVMTDIRTWQTLTEDVCGLISEAHEQHYRELYPQLVTCLDPADLINYLFQDGTVSRVQIENIQTKPNRDERMRELLDYSMRSDRGFFSFARALYLSKYDRYRQGE